ncbi:hypothetical protein LCGC14_2588480, partial [marine sediment metagenome]
SYSAGLGPGGENVQILTVDDSSSFSVSNHLRGQGKGAGEGHVHEILAIPDGNTIRVHSSSTDFDIIDGDTVEEVEPSGSYVGAFELDIDTYFNIADPTGELGIVVTTVATGNDPAFIASEQLQWTWNLELDLSGRGYRAG